MIALTSVKHLGLKCLQIQIWREKRREKMRIKRQLKWPSDRAWNPRAFDQWSQECRREARSKENKKQCAHQWALWLLRNWSRKRRKKDTKLEKNTNSQAERAHRVKNRKKRRRKRIKKSRTKRMRRTARKAVRRMRRNQSRKSRLRRKIKRR